ncbi:hypothetical protein BST29_22180 [Mycobacterium malmoense]|uniref:PE-PGRS family protein n=1 Tax=Mycobacterium malmoense TaxID=1780 RepID=A0ABX3SN10_MYCMA|nr:hypothetical protein BMG05_21020 [Mycobacterium malmoense]ORA78125.1 hypothetical protein BST29_22180 [Mycobacterium malmoense]
MVVEIAARPHITAGVALAAASVITAGPMMTQHLPDFHPAQQRSEANVSDINLTDASSTMMDLFSGVEDELASLVGGGAAAAAAVPAGILDGVVNPFQTWLNIIPESIANLQKLNTLWSADPFPVLQQVGANWLEYGTEYVNAWQTSANAATSFYFGNASTSFIPTMLKGIADLQAGKITAAEPLILNALFSTPLQNIGQPLENILFIPAQMATNFGKFVNSTATYVPLGLVLTGVLGLVQGVGKTLGASIQAAYNAWNAGETLGAVTDLLDIPGQLTSSLLNGPTGTAGLVGGVLSTGIYQIILQDLQISIVTPGAQDIFHGGSLVAGLQGLTNTLTNGWPNLAASLGTLGPQLTSVLQGVPAALANVPSYLAGMAGSLASHLGTLLTQLLGLL